MYNVGILHVQLILTCVHWSDMFKEIAGQQLEGGDSKRLYNVKNGGGRGRRGRKGDVQNVYCIDFFFT